jgi:hypothetical protein
MARFTLPCTPIKNRNRSASAPSRPRTWPKSVNEAAMPLKRNEAGSSFPRLAACELTDEAVENHQPLKHLYTVKQFALLYGLSTCTVHDRIKSGQLQAVRRPGHEGMRTGWWYVVDPGWLPAVNYDTAKHGKEFFVDDVYILKGEEVALLLGISTRRVRKMVEIGQLKCSYIASDKKIRRYCIRDVRTAMGVRMKMKDRDKRPTRKAVRDGVVGWAMNRLNMDKLPEKNNGHGQRTATL